MRIHTDGKLSGHIERGETAAGGDLRRPTNPAVTRRGAVRAAETPTTQDDQRRDWEDGVDEREEGNDEQGGQERTVVRSVGEPFTT
jgi:hypothetical protein